MSDDKVQIGGYTLTGDLDGNPAPLQCTLRDQFAMAALQALVSINGRNIRPDEAANASYTFADAMMRARGESA